MLNTAQMLDFIFHLALKLNKTTFLIIKLETFHLLHFKALKLLVYENCEKNSKHF